MFHKTYCSAISSKYSSLPLILYRRSWRTVASAVVSLISIPCCPFIYSHQWRSAESQKLHCTESNNRLLHRWYRWYSQQCQWWVKVEIFCNGNKFITEVVMLQYSGQISPHFFYKCFNIIVIPIREILYHKLSCRIKDFGFIYKLWKLLRVNWYNTRPPLLSCKHLEYNNKIWTNLYFEVFLCLSCFSIYTFNLSSVSSISKFRKRRLLTRRLQVDEMKKFIERVADMYKEEGKM